jgi:membrane protein DedA with SNARE-associated domain
MRSSSARRVSSRSAGARRIRLGTFIVLTAAGCALWALALVLTGVLVGAAWMTVDSALGRVLLVVGSLTLALTLLHRRAE